MLPYTHCSHPYAHHAALHPLLASTAPIRPPQPCSLMPTYLGLRTCMSPLLQHLHVPPAAAPACPPCYAACMSRLLQCLHVPPAAAPACPACYAACMSRLLLCLHVPPAMPPACPTCCSACISRLLQHLPFHWLPAMVPVHVLPAMTPVHVLPAMAPVHVLPAMAPVHVLQRLHVSSAAKVDRAQKTAGTHLARQEKQGGRELARQTAWPMAGRVCCQGTTPGWCGHWQQTVNEVASAAQSHKTGLQQVGNGCN